MAEVKKEIETFARIKVIGVGGAGNAAINRMIEANVGGVDFVAINTDSQALHHSKAKTKLHIGKSKTRGLGAGADPNLGRDAAQESKEEIAKEIKGADMVFVTIGAGGGTGSGAGPIVAQVASDLGILTVGIATKPFAFEGEQRRRNAEEAIDNLRQYVDTLITIPNDRLLQTIDRRTPLLDAFKVVDDVLRQGVQGISDLITIHGLINLDFADVKAIMSKAGSALMGIGTATGDNRATEAAQQAIESPLLEVSIDGARGVLFNVTGGMDMSMHEINEAAETITAAVDSNAKIIFGATLDPSMTDELKITVIATGFDAAYYVEARRNAASSEGLAYFNKPNDGATNDDDQQYQSQSSVMQPTEEEVSSINMALDSSADTEDEPEEESAPSGIWSIDDEDDEEELDTPAFVRKHEQDDDSDDEEDEA